MEHMIVTAEPSNVAKVDMTNPRGGSESRMCCTRGKLRLLALCRMLAMYQRQDVQAGIGGIVPTGNTDGVAPSGNTDVFLGA